MTKKAKRERSIASRRRRRSVLRLQVAVFFSPSLIRPCISRARRGCDVRSEIRYDRNARIESCRTNNSAEVFRVAAHGAGGVCTRREFSGVINSPTECCHWPDKAIRCNGLSPGPIKRAARKKRRDRTKGRPKLFLSNINNKNR